MKLVSSRDADLLQKRNHHNTHGRPNGPYFSIDTVWPAPASSDASNASEWRVRTCRRAVAEEPSSVGTSVSTPPTPPSIPSLPRDPKMQAYFHRMQQTVHDTCHPRELHAEAVRMVDAMLSSKKAASPDVAEWAQELFNAGIGRLEYGRSMAVLMYHILMDLSWHSWQLSRLLTKELLAVATEIFTWSWKDADFTLFDGMTGLEPMHPILEASRTHLTNTAAFLGDMFALGILPRKSVCDMVSLLVQDPRSMTHCRALYLLLLHGRCRLRDLQDEFLVNCRRDLVWHATHRSMFIKDDMAKRWLIEICHIIDIALCEEEEDGYLCDMLTHHRWNRALAHHAMSSLLQPLHEKLPHLTS